MTSRLRFPRSARPVAALLAAAALVPWPGSATADIQPVRAGEVVPQIVSIGSFTGDEADIGGCGCSFYPAAGARGSGPLLLRVNADGRATMRLDGDLVDLRKTRENLVRRSKKTMSSGDKLLLTLRGDAAAASINAALERSCRVADGCRQLTYTAVIGVSRGAKRGSTAAWGLCSC